MSQKNDYTLTEEQIDEANTSAWEKNHDRWEAEHGNPTVNDAGQVVSKDVTSTK